MRLHTKVHLEAFVHLPAAIVSRKLVYQVQEVVDCFLGIELFTKDPSAGGVKRHIPGNRRGIYPLLACLRTSHVPASAHVDQVRTIIPVGRAYQRQLQSR